MTRKPLNPNKSLSFRPGALTGPLQARIDRTGETPSEVIRIALAKLLRVSAPEMPVGNPEMSKTAKRWNEERKKR